MSAFGVKIGNCHIVFTVAQWGTVKSNFNIYYVFLQFAPCENCLCNCVVKWFLNYSNQLLKLTLRDGALLNLNCHEIETEARQTFHISSLSSFRIHFAATTDVEPLQNSVKTSKMVFFCVAVNNFRKTLHLGCLAGFWTHFSIIRVNLLWPTSFFNETFSKRNLEESPSIALWTGCHRKVFSKLYLPSFPWPYLWSWSNNDVIDQSQLPFEIACNFLFCLWIILR